eukprot:673289-Rhodomonas_salina.2
MEATLPFTEVKAAVCGRHAVPFAGVHWLVLREGSGVQLVVGGCAPAGTNFGGGCAAAGGAAVARKRARRPRDAGHVPIAPRTIAAYVT